jgi:citrate lyase subunit beta/citryl-CoA lyase
MSIRSFLFVPGDSERKLAKGLDAKADALILDLEDAVAAARKPLARQMVTEFLTAQAADRKTELWVRINPLGEGGLDDLAAVARASPDGIVVPKTDGPADVQRLSHYLDILEKRDGVAAPIRILPVATETARAPFRLGDYADVALPRLYGLTWGAEDLSSAIGASTNKNAAGDWAFTYQMVRSACLLAAKAAGVEAVETLYADFRDGDGLRQSCIAAAQEGFSGRIAIHPAQVEVVNAAFMPSEEAVLHARRVVAAFEAAPDAGAVGLDGMMLDMPHLKQARHVIALHASYNAPHAHT